MGLKMGKEMIVVEAILSPSFFSIRIPEVFQVADTYPLPPPSTIAGAFAYSYAIWKGINFEEALRIFANDKNWYFAIPLSEITISSVILRRIRILQAKADPIRDRKKELQKVQKVDPRAFEALSKFENRLKKRADMLGILKELGLDYYYSYYETKMFDAMFRRYAFTPRMYIGALINIDERFPLSFTRIGDTESHVTVSRVEYIDNFYEEIIAASKIIDFNAYLPLSNDIKSLEGDFVIYKMTLPTFLLDRDIKQSISMVIPLKKIIKKVNKKDVEVYVPSIFKVSFSSDRKVYVYKSRLLGKEVIIPISP